jgi:predicted molibdopterin-dependent oxidoreductase YjgC
MTANPPPPPPQPQPPPAPGALAFTFDGAPLSAEPGQSIGAALIAAGHRSWRTTRREGRPRGLFCGIGVCFDCLVTVNGRPGRRACLLEVRDGDAVDTQHGAGHDDLAC